MVRRPALWTVHYVMVTKVPDREEYLSWNGGPEETGNYLWWAQGKGNEQPVKVEL